MIRYSCDMCGKSLLPGEDVRYVVKIEVFSTYDSVEPDDDLDEELIDDFEEEDDDDIEDFDSDEIDEGEYKTFRFDLCSKCHNKYLQDPLSIKSIRRGRFSEN